MNLNKKKKVEKFFKNADLKIYPYIKTINWDNWINPDKNERERFTELCKTIISQQLGGASARAIIVRFLDLFPNKTPTPELVLKLKTSKIKTGAKTSTSKANYIINLANAVHSNELDLKNINKLSDDEIQDNLIKIKGIGDWTADMFLMFSLGKENIYSYGDYGLKKGLMKVYGLKKLPDNKKITKITQIWDPYKTYGSIALWHSLEV